MKRLLLLVSAVGLMAHVTNAQQQLESGQPDFHSLFKTPLIHYDALRQQQAGWLREVKNNDGSWELQRKYTSTIAEPGLFSLITDSLYNPAQKKWELQNYFKYVYEKNDNNRILAIAEISRQNRDQIYSDNRKNKFTYNANGKFIQVENQQFDSFNNGYRTEHVTFSSYNNEGYRVKDSISLNFVDDYYIIDHYEYNQFGECIKMVSIANNNGVFDTLQIIRLVYDNGKISRYISYNNHNGVMKLDQQINYAYNENGHVTFAGFLYPDNNEELKLYEAYYMGYTAIQKLAYISAYTTDKNNGVYMPTDSVALTYLSNGDITTSYGYTANPNTKTWITSPQYRFTFRDDLSNAVKKIQPAQHAFNIYPNPVSNKLTIEANHLNESVKTYTVLDLQGKIVLNGDATTTVWVEDLPAGLYLLRLETAHNSYQTKFIKE